jgi:hypothetical protein
MRHQPRGVCLLKDTVPTRAGTCGCVYQCNCMRNVVLCGHVLYIAVPAVNIFFMRITVWILSSIVLAVIVVGGYYSMRMGLIGGSYWYYQCEHGYATYPYGVTDSAKTYYDSTNKQIGVCNSWIPGPSCAPAQKIAGECDTEGVVRWSLFYKQ